MSTPKKYWFKRRRYGYGWVPVTYDGWMVFGIYLTLIIITVAAFRDTPEKANVNEGFFIATFVFMTLCLICIAIAKGPQPKWRWGKKDDDNPDEDY